MIINLFSIFDPSTISLKYAWAPCFVPIFIFFYSFFRNMSRKTIVLSTILSSFLRKELSSLIYPHEKKMATKMVIRIFFACLAINLIALTPFSFTPTAHLTISFTIALTFWVSFMVIGWSKNFSHMISHLVPSGTPVQLMNFIVLIETVRNLIRPITLSVRLSANMVAGHLLISLLGRFCLLRVGNLLSFPLILALSVLELGVSFIQAYVLITLVTLYSTEIH